MYSNHMPFIETVATECFDTERPLQPEVECVVFKWMVMDCVWSPTEEEERRYTERHDTNLTFFWRHNNAR